MGEGGVFLYFWDFGGGETPPKGGVGWCEFLRGRIPRSCMAPEILVVIGPGRRAGGAFKGKNLPRLVNGAIGGLKEGSGF